MRFRPTYPKLVRAWISALLWLPASSVVAQEYDELLIGGVPLENAVVGRDIAVRIQAEVQLTEDADDLIDEDPNYVRFPSRLYSAGVGVYQYNRLSVNAEYATWENNQDVDLSHCTADVRTPFPRPESSNFLTLRLRGRETVADNDILRRLYAYASVSRSFDNGIFAHVQYRLATTRGEITGNQLYHYLSWRVSDRFRFGALGAASRNKGSDTLEPWYAEVFTTIFIINELTSIRLGARHYESTSGLAYQQYNSYLYQKIGRHSLLRLHHRFYHDSDELHSHAYGVKAKCYFHPRVSAHVGYRYYDHSEGADFDTFYGGFGLLL